MQERGDSHSAQEQHRKTQGVDAPQHLCSKTEGQCRKHEHQVRPPPSEGRDGHQRGIEGPLVRNGPGHAGQQVCCLVSIDIGLCVDQTQGEPLKYRPGHRTGGFVQLEAGACKHDAQHHDHDREVHGRDAKQPADVERAPTRPATRAQQLSPEQKSGQHEEDRHPDGPEQCIETGARHPPDTGLDEAACDDQMEDEHAQCQEPP